MKKSELRVAVQEMDTHQFGLKNELHNKLTKVTSYVPKKEVIDLINQLEEPEQDIDVAYDLLQENTTLSQEDFDLYWNCINDGVAVSELKQKKVVVPQFVADFIEEIKPNFNIRAVFTLKNNEHKKGQEWALNNPDVFARAWLDGYTVEKEKRYYVYDKATKSYLGYNAVRTQLNWCTSRLENESFTEQEIKSIDERYWAFAEEVTK